MPPSDNDRIHSRIDDVRDHQADDHTALMAHLAECGVRHLHAEERAVAVQNNLNGLNRKIDELTAAIDRHRLDIDAKFLPLRKMEYRRTFLAEIASKWWAFVVGVPPVALLAWQIIERLLPS